MLIILGVCSSRGRIWQHQVQETSLITALELIGKDAAVKLCRSSSSAEHRQNRYGGWHQGNSHIEVYPGAPLNLPEKGFFLHIVEISGEVERLADATGSLCRMTLRIIKVGKVL